MELMRGMNFTIKGSDFYVVHAEPDADVVLEGKNFVGRRSYKYDFFRQLLEAGTVTLSSSQDVHFGPDGLPPIPQALSSNQKKEWMRRYRYIQFFELIGGPVGSGARYKEQINEAARILGDDKPPARATFYDWLARWKWGEADPVLLAPRHDRKGRREGQVPYEVMRIFFDAADRYFLTTQRMSRKNFHRIVVDLVLRENAKRERASWLPLPSYNAVCEWVRFKIDRYIFDLRRFGRAYADRQFRRRGQCTSALYPLERVEIDHTQADVFVCNPDDRSDRFRPWISVAICRRTRMVLAIYLSWDAPSRIAVLNCLSMAVRPKDAVLKQYDIPAHLWPAQGMIRLLVMDNGPEFHSEANHRFGEEFAIDLQYCAPEQPDQKGCVERFMGTMNWGILHELPGTTWSNPTERGAYRSSDMATLTLEELRRLLLLWVTIEYHQRTHRELGESPLACWERLTKEHPVAPPPASREIELSTGLVFPVAIKGGAVRIKNLFYTHGLLSRIAHSFKGKTDIRINPANVLEAYLVDPATKALIELRCTNPEIEAPMGWKEFQTMHKEKQRRPPEDEAVRKARVDLVYERADLWADAEKAYEKERRKKKASKTPKETRPVPPANKKRPSSAPMFKEEDNWTSGIIQ